MRRFLFLLVMMVSAVVVSAQKPGINQGHSTEQNTQFNAKKFEADLEKFVLKEAEISHLEAMRFLPIYREKRKKEVATMEAMRKHRKGRPTSEREWEEAMKAHDNMELELKKIQITYHNRMLRVIPASKVVKAIRAEEKYHREAFGKMRERTGHQTNRSPHHGFGH